MIPTMLCLGVLKAVVLAGEPFGGDVWAQPGSGRACSKTDVHGSADAAAAVSRQALHSAQRDLIEPLLEDKHQRRGQNALHDLCAHAPEES